LSNTSHPPVFAANRRLNYKPSSRASRASLSRYATWRDTHTNWPMSSLRIEHPIQPLFACSSSHGNHRSMFNCSESKCHHQRPSVVPTTTPVAVHTNCCSILLARFTTDTRHNVIMTHRQVREQQQQQQRRRRQPYRSIHVVEISCALHQPIVAYRPTSCCRPYSRQSMDAVAALLFVLRACWRTNPMSRRSTSGCTSNRLRHTKSSSTIGCRSYNTITIACFTEWFVLVLV
jgi:hypothetical protein